MIRATLLWLGLGMLASSGLVSADELCRFPSPNTLDPTPGGRSWARPSTVGGSFRFDANDQGGRDGLGEA